MGSAWPSGLRADKRPRFSPAAAERLARDLYGLEGRASPLPSDRDQNFKLECGGAGDFVLKVFHQDEDPALVEAQRQVFGLLAPLPRGVFPTLRPTSSGAPYARTEAAEHGQGEGHHLVWLTRFMAGSPAAYAQDLPTALLRDLGALLGEMDAVLAHNPQPAARRTLLWAAQSAPGVIARHAHAFEPAKRRLLEEVLSAFEAHVRPRLAELRTSLIHNDVNDHNLLLEGGRVSAILDFGDMLESYTVCEAAHAAAYLMLDRPDPLRVAVDLVDGYHAAYPLSPLELSVLYDLIRLRLALSVAVSAYQQRLRPGDPYLSVSEAPAWRLLERLASGDPPREEFVAAMMALGGGR